MLLEPKFYCLCSRDHNCDECLKPQRLRYRCIIPRATDCHHMSSTEVCPCLYMEVSFKREVVVPCLKKDMRT